MQKNKQIIVRMSERQKDELTRIAAVNGCDVSKLVRNLIYEYVRQQEKIKGNSATPGTACN